MARRAILVARIRQVVGRGQVLFAIGPPPERARSVVAFQTNGEDDGTTQHLSIRRAMRAVTGLATIDPNGSVLVDERPPFVGVALQAGLFIDRLLHHARAGPHAPGSRKCAVRIMTIRALNHAFVDTMLERHRELGAHLAMAAVAEVGLALLGEQESRRLGSVDRMAIDADYVFLRVDAAADVGPR
jgi:hypothetical protein